MAGGWEGQGEPGGAVFSGGGRELVAGLAVPSVDGQLPKPCPRECEAQGHEPDGTAASFCPGNGAHCLNQRLFIDLKLDDLKLCRGLPWWLSG